MPTKTLSWDNSDVLASGNATGQQASKRIKAVGGAFDTTGFTPGNPLAKAATTTDATILANRVYEFKVEGLCTVGGPTINNNGLVEDIFFECIAPSFTPASTSIQVVVDLTNTDITKVRFVLKKISDDSTVGTQTVNKVGTSSTANFTGLTSSTGYYVELEYYAVVGGVEVISSDEDFLGAVCGEYNTATTAPATCPAPKDLVIGTPV